MEFLKWFYSESKKIKPDVYMVGENWTGNSEIVDMYESKADSFFSFGFADSSGAFVTAVRNHSSFGLVSSVEKFEKNTKKSNKDRINAFFLSNHDQKRSANYLKTVGLKGTKMAAALYMLMPGNPFIYYGEEIGLIQDSSKNEDEYKREPMIWDSEKLPDIVVNNIAKADKSHAQFGGVKQQEKDKNSLLNFYKRIIKIKNQNPAIARGTLSEYKIGDPEIAAYKVTAKDALPYYIIHNLSGTEAKEIELKTLSTLRGDLVASNDDKTDEHVILDNNTKLKLPPYSTAVLQELP